MFRLVQLTLQQFSFRMDDSLVISWSDQHETKLPLSWLRENCYSRANLEARRNRQQPYLWDVPAIEKRGGFPQFEYSRVMNDDKAVWEWVKALNKYGCALVVNGPTTEGSIAALTERFATELIALPKLIDIHDSSKQNRVHTEDDVRRHFRRHICSKPDQRCLYFSGATSSYGPLVRIHSFRLHRCY